MRRHVAVTAQGVIGAKLAPTVSLARPWAPRRHGRAHVPASYEQPPDVPDPDRPRDHAIDEKRGGASNLPEEERERIRAAAREAASQFPPMSGELVALVRNTLLGRTR